jgi:hypothetical protein
MIVLEEKEGYCGKRHYGMRSSDGDSVDTLNSDYKVTDDGKPMPFGSDCFDYTTQTPYFFDGESWN